MSAASQSGWIELGGRNKFPTILQSSQVVVADKSGLSIQRRNYLLTRQGDYLSRDFKFEVVYTLKEGTGNDIVFIGMGEADRNTAYNEPNKSVYIKIHPSNIDNGYVVLCNKPVASISPLGKIPRGGTHRASIEKIGDVVVFAIDVNNDGPSDDDLETTIPDITAVGPFLHKKNTFIFFGGGGVYHRLRLSAPESSKTEEKSAPAHASKKDQRISKGAFRSKVVEFTENAPPNWIFKEARVGTPMESDKGYVLSNLPKEIVGGTLIWRDSGSGGWIPTGAVKALKDCQVYAIVRWKYLGKVVIDEGTFARLDREGWKDAGEVKTTFPGGEDWRWKALVHDVSEGDVSLPANSVNWTNRAVFFVFR
jgi:hypothetical protein